MGDTKWEKGVETASCDFLRFPAVFCSFLRLQTTYLADQGSNLQKFGGKKVFTKGVFGSENWSTSTSKKEVCVCRKACFQGKKKENTYTPKSLQGVCGGPLRAALVYIFWPPKNFRCCQRTTARKTPATSHGVGSRRGVDQELANLWTTLCTKSCLGDFVLVFS